MYIIAMDNHLGQQLDEKIQLKNAGHLKIESKVWCSPERAPFLGKSPVSWPETVISELST